MIEIINRDEIKENGDVFVRCPYNGFSGACPYWVCFDDEGLRGCWCFKETRKECDCDGEED